MPYLVHNAQFYGFLGDRLGKNWVRAQYHRLRPHAFSRDVLELRWMFVEKPLPEFDYEKEFKDQVTSKDFSEYVFGVSLKSGIPGGLPAVMTKKGFHEGEIRIVTEDRLKSIQEHEIREKTVTFFKTRDELNKEIENMTDTDLKEEWPNESTTVHRVHGQKYTEDKNNKYPFVLNVCQIDKLENETSKAYMDRVSDIRMEVLRWYNENKRS